MKLFFFGSLVVVALSFTTSCTGGGGHSGCTADSQCGAGETCNTSTGVCVGGEGEGEGASGEGEGEGEGEGSASPCATQQAVFGNPGGDGSIASMTCTLEVDAANAGNCATASSAYAVVCDLGGYTITGDCAAGLCQGNEMQLSDDQPAPLQPHACATPPSLHSGKVTCPVCYDALPTGIAAQFTDKPGFNESAAVCVDESGAT